jgi:serine/threonine protein kinase
MSSPDEYGKEKEHEEAARPGSTLLDNRYEILSTIKAGGMGCVYRARDSRLGTVVALKKMISRLTNPDDIHYAEERFKEEARLLSMLHHGGLPKVFDYFTAEDKETGKAAHYLAMTYIEGKDLETVIIDRKRRPYAIDEALPLFRQVADILQYLHGQSPPIIYRDLNPRNIMVQGHRIFLVDFGIARLFTPQQKGTVIGTPGYAAPEQYKGAAEPRSDIYAMGVLMHYLMTGRNPEDSTLSLFTFESPIAINPLVPHFLDRLIMAMVDVIPERRPASAGEVLEALASRSDGAGASMDNAAPRTEPLVLPKSSPQPGPAPVPASPPRPFGSIFEALEKDDLAAAKGFLADGADVNEKKSKGWTPLHTAVYRGGLETVEYLLNKEADVNAVKADGWTALHLATHHGHKDIAALLISRGAKIDVQRNDGGTPLHSAAQGGYSEIAELLIARGANVNACMDDGRTPLHLAAYYGHKDMAELLLSHGAVVNARDRAGETPVKLARTYSHREVTNVLRKNGAGAWWNPFA